MPPLYLTCLPSRLTILTGLDASDLFARLEAMQCQEAAAAYEQIDYMAKRKEMMRYGANSINVECRILMCDWCYRVADLCNFQRETVAHAFSYVDRYLCTKLGGQALCDRNLYQIAAITALYIAVKVHETCLVNINTLVGWSGGAYSENEFEKMEIEMLKALEWRLSRPTATDFIRSFIGLVNELEDSNIRCAIVNTAQYQVELAVYSSSLVGRKPSEIAFAAIVNSIMEVDDSIISLNEKRDFMRSLKNISGLTAMNDDNMQIQGILYSLLEDMKPAVSQCWNGNEEINNNDFCNNKAMPSSSDLSTPSSSTQERSPISTAA